MWLFKDNCKSSCSLPLLVVKVELERQRPLWGAASTVVLSQWGKKSKKMGSLRPTRETPEHYINDCIIALRERHHTELKRTDTDLWAKKLCISTFWESQYLKIDRITLLLAFLAEATCRFPKISQLFNLKGTATLYLMFEKVGSKCDTFSGFCCKWKSSQIWGILFTS